jgi:glycine betaine/proline transport system permease protein
MGKYKKYIFYSLYLIAIVAMVIAAYTSSKYRPESLSILFTDLSWLGNWPKWLDLPLMPFLNEGFDKLIVKYGMFFEGINNFLLGLYTQMKN